MGEHHVSAQADPAALRALTLSLMDDLDALDYMLRHGLIESGVRRIGAEQELFLVDSSLRPAPICMELLEALDDGHFDTELGRYNLEINLDPLPWGPRCLSDMLQQLQMLLARVREGAARFDASPLLVGTLPTLRKTDTGMENMTPRPRYLALGAAMNALRGDHWRVYVRGIDELASRHDTVMLESCCTSFQVHLQVGPEEFAQRYNAAQAVLPMVLAVAVNSPFLFGRRLWHETRIPLFQQSIDARRTGTHLREAAPRVRFGERWLDDSILELLREDAVRFRILIDGDGIRDPFTDIDAGAAPELRALRLHGGTVYRWNRGCYGIHEGRPHLRIEMRALPSGPTPVDEMANAAFFYGLVLGLPDVTPDVRRVLRFDDARANFQATAKNGLEAQVTWFGGNTLAVRDLILEMLLPIAQQGLVGHGIDADEARRFLDIVEERALSRCTGARWQLGSYARLAADGAGRQQAITAITAEMARNQERGEPVHAWPWASLEGGRQMNPARLRVEDVMSTDLHTIGPDEPIDLVGKIMQWRQVRHIPVEDGEHRLLGMLSCFHVLQFLGERRVRTESPPASSVMTRDVPCVGPEAPVAIALSLMREQGSDCLPVVQGERLVGIVTERDLVRILWQVLCPEGGAP